MTKSVLFVVVMDREFVQRVVGDRISARVGSLAHDVAEAG
jgi:hypothetical protein